MPRDQKVIDFNQMLNAIDIICQFCSTTDTARCQQCGANLTIKENWDKLTSEQKARCDCPWNGIQGG